MTLQPCVKLVFGRFFKSQNIGFGVKTLHKCRRLLAAAKVDALLTCGKGHDGIGKLLAERNYFLKACKVVFLHSRKVGVAPLDKLQVAHHGR